MLISDLLNFGTRVLYAPDGVDGGGNVPAAQTGDQDGDQKPDKTPQTGDQDDGGDGGETVHKIPQSKLDERLERARNEAVNKALKELGVDSLDALKGIVESETARRRGEMSDLERATKDLEKVTSERDDWKGKFEALQESVKTERLESAIVTAAQGASVPRDVIVWAREYAPDDLAAVMDKDGKVDDAKVKALVGKCKKDRPHWFGGKGPGVPSNSDGHTAGTAEEVKKVERVAIAQAKRFIS